ncbi:MAG: hypothetical protein ACXQTM_04075 [Methanosarcinales archaeon]
MCEVEEIILDRGPWYRDALQRPCVKFRDESFGKRSLVESVLSSFKERAKIFFSSITVNFGRREKIFGRWRRAFCRMFILYYNLARLKVNPKKHHYLFSFMGKKNRTVRPKYGSKVRISKLKPLFKEKYINLDDTIKLSEKEVLAGGWLNKILKGVASPKCGEIIGKPEDWYGLIRTGLKDFLRFS